MKNIPIVTIFLVSIVLSSVAHAARDRWTKVAESVLGDTYHVDFNATKIKKDKIIYFLLTNFKEPIDNDYSTIQVNILDCGGLFTSMREIKWQSQSFKAPWAGGTAEHSSLNGIPISERSWRYPPSDSVWENVLEVVCKHKKDFGKIR